MRTLAYVPFFDQDMILILLSLGEDHGAVVCPSVGVGSHHPCLVFSALPVLHLPHFLGPCTINMIGLNFPAHFLHSIMVYSVLCSSCGFIQLEIPLCICLLIFALFSPGPPCDSSMFEWPGWPYSSGSTGIWFSGSSNIDGEV